MVNTTLKWTAVTSDEVADQKYRLEASVFKVEAKKAKDDLLRCKFPSLKMWDFIHNAHYGGRMKRNYVRKSKTSIGFLGSSEMLQILPKPEKFFSITNVVSSLKVIPETILISRSGTIGNLTYVNETLSKFLVSEHAIRLIPKSFGGYLYAFLRTKTGQTIVKSNTYGAVISQIEPEHLGAIEIPNPPNEIKSLIHQKIKRSFALRDQSNALMDEAENLLVTALKLPPIEEIQPDYYRSGAGVKTYSVPLDELHHRMDASYHVPIVGAIIDFLLDNAAKILPLDSPELTKKIILPGRFKRHYVEEEYGTVFLGGKQIYELDPYNKKYLSVKKHGNRITNELFIHENTLLITRSGTIGKVNIVPKHWENWIISEHVLRAVPKDASIAGYLYVWLNSDYGKELITRHTYGSVVDEIDDRHLGEVPIPILSDKKLMERINNLSLEANKLRTEAYYLEQTAIEQVNAEVIYV